MIKIKDYSQGWRFFLHRNGDSFIIRMVFFLCPKGFIPWSKWRRIWEIVLYANKNIGKWVLRIIKFGNGNMFHSIIYQIHGFFCLLGAKYMSWNHPLIQNTRLSYKLKRVGNKENKHKEIYKNDHIYPT